MGIAKNMTGTVGLAQKLRTLQYLSAVGAFLLRSGCCSRECSVTVEIRNQALVAQSSQSRFTVVTLSLLQDHSVVMRLFSDQATIL